MPQKTYQHVLGMFIDTRERAGPRRSRTAKEVERFRLPNSLVHPTGRSCKPDSGGARSPKDCLELRLLSYDLPARREEAELVRLDEGGPPLRQTHHERVEVLGDEPPLRKLCDEHPHRLEEELRLLDQGPLVAAILTCLLA